MKCLSSLLPFDMPWIFSLPPLVSVCHPGLKDKLLNSLEQYWNESCELLPTFLEGAISFSPSSLLSHNSKQQLCLQTLSLYPYYTQLLYNTIEASYPYVLSTGCNTYNVKNYQTRTNTIITTYCNLELVTSPRLSTILI